MECRVLVYKLAFIFLLRKEGDILDRTTAQHQKNASEGAMPLLS